MNGTAGDYRRGFAGMNGAAVAPADVPAAPATPPPRVNGAASPPTSAAAALRQSSRSFMSSMLADDVDFVGRVKEQISSLSPAGLRSQEAFQKPSPDSSKDSLKDSLSPGSASSPQKRSPGAVRVVEFTSQSKSYVRTVVSSKTVVQSSNSVDNSPFSSLSESTVTEISTQQSSQSAQVRSPSSGTAVENTLTGSPKSFIQQRIERLYGPGALAQGFFSRTRQLSRSEDPTSQQVTTVEESYIYVGSPEATQSEGPHPETPRSAGSHSPSLPVLRHLRPEFRAQLPLTPGAPRSPRRTVKATEDESSVAAVTPAPRTPPVLQHQTSIESIADSQPAAPDVPVLAVDQPKSPLPAASSLPSPVEVAPSVAPVFVAHQPLKAEITAVPPVEVLKTTDNSEDRDGHYFLQVLHEEVVRLTALVESAEAELNSEAAQHYPEEALGKLRAAAGKARLLMKQKLQQFEGLCHKNISQSPEEVFPTTAQDLAGFWDMVKLQVDHVDRLFLELDKLRAAGWVEASSDSSSTTVSSGATQRRRPPGTRRGASSQPSQQTPDQRQAAETARKAREAARRQMMEERRRAMRQKQQQQNVEIYVPTENGK